MRKLFYLIFALFVFSSGMLFFTGFKPEKNNLISPVLGVSKIRIADNLWFPKFSSDSAIPKDAPEITSKAALFVDTQTGEVLYQKNPYERMPVASLTKIMTVVITMESKKMDDVIVISETAASMEPDRMLLKPFEKLTVEELLGGIFLVSANDAAEALAESVTGEIQGFVMGEQERLDNRTEFIRLMNEKATQLSMKDTQFLNPTGLQEDQGEQYSSAFDVTLMSRYALRRWPELLQISSKEHIYLPPTPTHQDYDLYSGINLITTYPGVVGFKTGFTPEAGLTLVTVVHRDGKEVLGVLLGSTNRRDDAKELLDYSFKKLGV